MDVATKEKLFDHVEWVKFSAMSWKDKGFYYSCYDKPEEGEELSGRNEFHKVKYHKLGTPYEEDKLIFDDPESPLKNFYAQVTDDEKFLFIYESEGTSGNALYMKNLTYPGSDFELIAPGFENEYNVIDNLGDNILVRTNFNAPTWKLMKVDAKNPQLANWKVLIEENQKSFSRLT